jgi:hypothetical protein
MKGLRRLLAACPFLFCGCRASDLVADSSFDGMGGVRLEVRDAEVNRAVHYVRVYVRSDSLTPSMIEPPTVMSDTTGVVQLDNLRPGTYWITVRRMGYTAMHQRVEVSARALRVVRIDLSPPICTVGWTDAQIQRWLPK